MSTSETARSARRATYQKLLGMTYDARDSASTIETAYAINSLRDACSALKIVIVSALLWLIALTPPEQPLFRLRSFHVC